MTSRRAHAERTRSAAPVLAGPVQRPGRAPAARRRTIPDALALPAPERTLDSLVAELAARDDVHDWWNRPTTRLHHAASPPLPAHLRTLVAAYLANWHDPAATTSRLLRLAVTALPDITAAPLPAGTPDKDRRDTALAARMRVELPLTRALAAVLHSRTQTHLAGHRINELTVHRGGRITPAPVPGQALTLPPLSTWTLDPDQARTAAAPVREDHRHGYVHSLTVPADRVLALPVTGLGQHTRHEVVLLGAGPETPALRLLQPAGD